MVGLLLGGTREGLVLDRTAEMDGRCAYKSGGDGSKEIGSALGQPTGVKILGARLYLPRTTYNFPPPPSWALS